VFEERVDNWNLEGRLGLLGYYYYLLLFVRVRTRVIITV